MSADVIVVGSANIDLIVHVARLPVEGETVTGGHLTRGFGGKGANAAAVAATLGVTTAFVAAVGDDEDGRDVRKNLITLGIDCHHLMPVSATTGLAVITVDEAGENTIVVASGANALLDEDTVTCALADLAAPASVVLCNLEIADAAIDSAARYCAAHGLALIIDPGPARPINPLTLQACCAITPNRGELAVLARSSHDLLDAGVGLVVTTLGADGAELHQRGKAPVRIQPTTVTSVDSTGAGDAFAAAFAVALQRGQSPSGAAQFASVVGALSTRALGARNSLPTQREVDALMHSDRPAKQG